MRNLLGVLLLLPLILSCANSGVPENTYGAPVKSAATVGRYANPLPIQTPDETNIVSCPDPSIIRSQNAGDNAWYMYCTNDVLNDNGPVHLMAIARSTDLTHWTYVGDVFRATPSFLPAGAGLWAPDIQFFNGRYYLYYAVSATVQGGMAIFVATSASPAGPFTAVPNAVVPAEKLADGSWRWVIDPSVAEENGERYIFYGSYNGGISLRRLASDGLSTVPDSEVQIAHSNRYEASYVINRDGYYYLFVSSGNCCAGAGTGYGVFVGRATLLAGPYVDRDGVSLMDPMVGGTPVLAMNGNRWLGPGHNAVVTDMAGQDWMLYHAVDGLNPLIHNSETRRPAMLDRLDWIDQWPTVRSGAGASDTLVQAPAMSSAAPLTNDPPAALETMGALIPGYSDDFANGKYSAHWSWTNGSAQVTFGPLSPGGMQIATQAGELANGTHSAPLFTEGAPSGDFVAEVELHSTLPESGGYNAGVHNNVESGLVFYQDDSHYLKLVRRGIGETRQLEFSRQDGAVWGSSYMAAATSEQWLRLARHGQVFTAYSSRDGATWTRGPSWALGSKAPTKLGLISAGGTGYATEFSYVKVGERE